MQITLIKANVKVLITSDGMDCLLELLPLAHLHVNRARTTAASNVIEANPENTQNEQTKEWYYTGADNERIGPITLDQVGLGYCRWDYNSRRARVTVA